MSIEHEMAEISTIYHGQRARMEELVQLVHDLWLFIEEQCDLDDPDIRVEVASLQQRIHELAGGFDVHGT